MPLALPVYSVDTIEQAEDLQIALCCRTYDGRYALNGFAEYAETHDVIEALDWAANKMRTIKSG